MRTDAEELKFAKTCELIEKEGGDVQGYIAQEYPSYTPRAVWYRLQRNYLGRKEFQLTEGTPKKKGVKYMGKMMELAHGCLEAYGRGESISDYLRSQGSKNPSAYWYQIKATAKLQDPDLYEQLSVIRTNDRKRRQEASKEPVPVDLGEHPEQVKEAVNRVFFGGKEYEKMDEPSPTCCQPAKPSGVTVPDELPKDDGLRVSAVESWHGKYELCGDREDPKFTVMAYQQRSFPNGSEIIFSPENWLKFAEEIPKALKRLGFKV